MAFNEVTIANFGEPVKVKIGDTVGFKSDVEQHGRIKEIRRSPSFMGGYELVLENPAGFGGEYLRYATTTVEHCDDCWA